MLLVQGPHFENHCSNRRMVNNNDVKQRTPAFEAATGLLFRQKEFRGIVSFPNDELFQLFRNVLGPHLWVPFVGLRECGSVVTWSLPGQEAS